MPQQVGGEPHALAQPPPVGLLGQVAVGQPRLPPRVAVVEGQPAPAVLALQADADDQFVLVRSGGRR